MKEYTQEELVKHIICTFPHGSSVYNIMPTEFSDIDIIAIVDDSLDFSEYPNKIYEQIYNLELKDFPGTVTFNQQPINRNYMDFDFQYINESTFIEMMKNHHIIAIESLWLREDLYHGKFDYAKYFTLDNWKLRQVISGIVNNSWAKCHKKLTEKRIMISIVLLNLYFTVYDCILLVFKLQEMVR